MSKYFFRFVICLIASIPILAQSQTSGEKIKVLLVGTFHFNNPGMDEHNAEVDDVFSDQRQKEIDDLNESLLRFNPNKIFVESRPVYQSFYDSLYQAFLNGKVHFEDLKNGRNETYQVGFKMAKELNHPKVYCSDASGLWLGSDVNESAEKWNMEFVMEFNERMKGKIEAYNKLIQNNSMKEIIRELNTEKSLMENHNYYVSIAPRVISGKQDGKESYYYDEETETSYVKIDEEYIGAELTAEWYKRNIKIYSNILNQIESGDKQIMVYYGQGHIKILQQLFRDNPRFEVVDALDYL